MIDLTAIQPHKVSRDLSGYITYIYGPAKAGKTTFATKAPGHLLLAFENGYNAIPGAMAQPITSWGDVKAVIRELKKPEVKEKFKVIVVDTCDIAATLCDKYICQQNDVDSISQIPYGGGWAKAKKEFEETWRTISQLGYSLIFISHSKDKTFKREDGSEYNQIIASCPSSYNDIIKNMSDLIGYIDMHNGDRRLVLRSLDNKVDVGCRFKEIAPVIPFGYDELVKALNEAIDAEAAATKNQFVTEERNVAPIAQEYDYDALMSKFQTIVGNLMQKDDAKYKPKIQSIVAKVLGRDKKVSDCTPDQAELISIIVDELSVLD